MPLANLGPHELSSRRLLAGFFDMRGGINVKGLPQEIEDDELTSGVNGYLRVDGAFEMRKGYEKHNTSVYGAGGTQGLFDFYQLVINGVAQASPVVTRLAQVGGNLFNVDTQAQIGAANALGNGALPWSAVRVYDPAAGAGGDALIVCTGVGGPYLISGSPLAISTPAGWATVAGARWVELVNGSVFFGGVPVQPNAVFACINGKPEQLAPGGVFALSQPVTGLGVLGAGVQSALVVGMQQGLVVIGGTGPDNFYQQEVPDEDGVVAGRTMITVNGILYYLGGAGIYMFDGSVPRRVSKNIEPWLLNDPLATGQFDFPFSNKSTAFSVWYLNRMMVFYNSVNGVQSGGNFPNTVAVLNLDTVPRPGRGWTVLSLGTPMNAACLLNAPSEATPPALLVGDAAVGTSYNWDVYNGLGTTGHNVDDNGVTIIATCISKYFKLGLPSCPKTVMRFYYDLFVEQFNSLLNLYTDYGATSSGQGLAAAPANASRFDSATFQPGGTGIFASGGETYIKQRVDMFTITQDVNDQLILPGIQGEAFAVGVASQDTNPPWRFAGGTFDYELMPLR